MQLSILLSAAISFALYSVLIGSGKRIPRYPETEAIINQTLFLLNKMNSTEIPAKVLFHLVDVKKDMHHNNTITVEFLVKNSNCTQLEWMEKDPKDCPPSDSRNISAYFFVTSTGNTSSTGEITIAVR
ncbi:hypothetical protein T4A_4712 [Trichinella pseudospiralis]|uniref:Cystatin domain-containing protein n=1 Tax=Trichinella pseudospiralis TaxID=6337 RepID=A0A0V1EIB8_TRIPS|nr:hypothetical protein T4A_4712 [Trichinella pseudospiralis]